MAEAVDWASLMRLGLGQLRLAPENFWAMTPAELLRAAEGAGLIVAGSGGIMNRAALEALMTAFPDCGADGLSERPLDERKSNA